MYFEKKFYSKKKTIAQKLRENVGVDQQSACVIYKCPQSDSEMDKSVEGSIQEPVRHQEFIETKQDSGPVETAKEESVENPEGELEAEKLSANVAVTVTSPQGTE